MTRLPTSIVLAALAALAPARPASAADPRETPPGAVEGGFVEGGFLATCEDLGRLCFADACGRDQIDAAEACRARCPSAVVMSVVPAACPVPGVVLRRRG